MPDLDEAEQAYEDGYAAGKNEQLLHKEKSIERWASYVVKLEAQIAELKKELDIWILGHAKLQSEHQAQIAAKDALLQECLDWFDAPFESDVSSDMEMAVRVRAALATPARETE